MACWISASSALSESLNDFPMARFFPGKLFPSNEQNIRRRKKREKRRGTKRIKIETLNYSSFYLAQLFKIKSQNSAIGQTQRPLFHNIIKRDGILQDRHWKYRATLFSLILTFEKILSIQLGVGSSVLETLSLTSRPPIVLRRGELY